MINTLVSGNVQTSFVPGWLIGVLLLALAVCAVVWVLDMGDDTLRCDAHRDCDGSLPDCGQFRGGDTEVEPFWVPFNPDTEEWSESDLYGRGEPVCPGDCHRGDMPDFDHYCDSLGIKPGEEAAAFGAWLNALSGWDGPMGEVTNE